MCLWHVSPKFRPPPPYKYLPTPMLHTCRYWGRRSPSAIIGDAPPVPTPTFRHEKFRQLADFRFFCGFFFCFFVFCPRIILEICENPRRKFNGVWYGSVEFRSNFIAVYTAVHKAGMKTDPAVLVHSNHLGLITRTAAKAQGVWTLQVPASRSGCRPVTGKAVSREARSENGCAR